MGARPTNSPAATSNPTTASPPSTASKSTTGNTGFASSEQSQRTFPPSAPSSEQRSLTVWSSPIFARIHQPHSPFATSAQSCPSGSNHTPKSLPAATNSSSTSPASNGPTSRPSTEPTCRPSPPPTSATSVAPRDSIFS